LAILRRIVILTLNMMRDFDMMRDVACPDLCIMRVIVPSLTLE
jgi:hypothetical protein